MITRRVANRLYRLRPGRRVNRIAEYVVAVLSEHYKLELHAMMVMSTHHHIRFHDPFAKASDFARDCHSFIARMIIDAYGDKDETLWAPVSTNYVEDDEPEGPIEQISYMMANPVAAGAVKFVRSWPGAKGRWPQQDRTVKQPPRFFQDLPHVHGSKTESGREKINWAKTATLRFTRPRGCDELTDNELALAINQAIDRRVKEAHEKHKNNPNAFPGRRAVKEISRRTQATGEEPKRGAKRVPSIRCTDPERRIERLSGLRQWRANYRACMKEWPSNRDVVFPYGTYKMRVIHGARVDEAPT